jgi:hypothetical protein
MTPRPHAWTRRAALASLFAGASLLTLPGCDPRTLIFFLQPFDPVIPAPGPKLKGKKIVVLVHVSPGAGSDYSDLTRELAREVTTALRKNLNGKITVVDPDKIAAWVEANPSWTDPSECAKKYEADMAIFLDVSKFDVEDPRSPNLMEGNSNIHIQVWEVAHPKTSRGYENKSQPKESNKIYEEQADTTFPVRGPIPRDTGISPSSFRIKFLKLVATEISWHFVDHEPGDDIQDVKFNPNDKN